LTRVELQTLFDTIDGAVETEITLTRDRLDLFDPVSELLTLRCIGETLNAIQIGTAVWTGIPVALETPPERGMLMASSLVGWLLVAAVSLLGLSMGMWASGLGPMLGV
jgi:F0F1-type ATP synthase membrane subunit c/vacuolar-type H+-ATPase subunit K